jgi:hypothetical protein
MRTDPGRLKGAESPITEFGAKFWEAIDAPVAQGK